MKVKFNRAALVEALNLVTSIIPARTTKPILQCLKIEAEAEAVSICATDFELGITCAISQVDVEEAGVVVVPADRLAAIVRESVDEVISVEVAEAVCQVRGADSHFTIYGYEADQYPAVPGFEGQGQIKVNLAKLQEGVEHCLFATAKENTRYALNGVLWEAKGKSLILVGTDGRRLAKVKVTLATAADKELQSEKIIVPAKAMGLMDRIGGGDKDEIEIRFVENRIVMSCAGVVISSNLVEGNFPKYEDIIPTDYDKKLELNTTAVLSAVRRAALLTNEDSKGVKLSLSKNALMFSGRAPEMGDAQVEMAVEYEGQPMEVGFNPQFLIDVLRVIKEDKFELHLSQADRPGLVKSGNNFVYIVMPVNIG